MNALLQQPLAVIIVGIIVLVTVVMGRNLSLKIGSIHAELRPNGGSTLRDAVDRVEQAAKIAVARAEHAAERATEAAAQAALTLDRMERAYPQHVHVDINHNDGTAAVDIKGEA